MSKIDEIMSDVQSFASTWALVGGRFDDGSMHNTAEAQSAELRELIAAALADARRDGADAMRTQLSVLTPEMARAACWRYTVQSAGDYARAVSASPLPTGPRQAVPLTDEQIKQARNKALCDAPDGVLMGRVARLPHQELRELSRAIEAASLAANNLEVRRG